MDDVTALRDALLAEVNAMETDVKRYSFEGREGIRAVAKVLAFRLPALIAAVEARAALTPERLAKALHEAEVDCWPSVDDCRIAPNHSGQARDILAALDEPRP